MEISFVWPSFEGPCNLPERSQTAPSVPNIIGGYRMGGAPAGLNDTYITLNATGGYSVGYPGSCGGLCTGSGYYSGGSISLW
jgi:hypothetical protein